MGIITNEILKNKYGYTFEDLLQGYQRSLKLIKKVDRPAYNKIVKIFKYYQATQPDKFNQMLEALKEHFLDEENNKHKLLECCDLRLCTEINPKTINLLFGYNDWTIDPCSWSLLDVSNITAYPFEVGEKDMEYGISPIFHDYKNMASGIKNGTPFYCKSVSYEFEFPGASTEREHEWVLYKDENDELKICKTDTIKDKTTEQKLKMDL